MFLTYGINNKYEEIVRLGERLNSIPERLVHYVIQNILLKVILFFLWQN